MRALWPHQIDGIDRQPSLTGAENPEVWAPVVGYEGYYEVSDRGRVRSLDRVAVQLNRWESCNSRRLPGKILTLTVDQGRYSYGRLQVKLCNVVQKTRLVHQLVAEAFLGPRPAGHEVAHCDGNTANNCVKNLRYDTPMGNTHDKFSHGTVLFGENCPTSKLTSSDIKEIRNLIQNHSGNDVADRFGISIAQVSRIKNMKQWRHVQ